jgi:hypothetical protein
MSTSSISTGRLCSDLLSGAEASGSQKNNDRKKRDVEQSAPTHMHHTHCTPMQLGTTADQRMTFLRTDFVKHAIWQGSIEKLAAKDFVARKVPTIEWSKV